MSELVYLRFIFFVYLQSCIADAPLTASQGKAATSENSVMLASTLSNKSRLNHKANSLSEGGDITFVEYNNDMSSY